MIPLDVLDERVTIQRVGSGSDDDWGTPVEEVQGTDEYHGRLVEPGFRGQSTSQEIIVGRDTVLIEYVLWLEPRATCTARDRAVVRGETWELMADPTLYREGPLAHHLEVPVRRIASG